jgi:hypothetical protein
MARFARPAMSLAFAATSGLFGTMNAAWRPSAEVGGRRVVHEPCTT